MREVQTEAHFSHFRAVVHVSGARLQHCELQSNNNGQKKLVCCDVVAETE